MESGRKPLVPSSLLLFSACCACAVTGEDFQLPLGTWSRTAEAGPLGARVGVYKGKNGQITVLILLRYSREMFSTQAERVV